MDLIELRDIYKTYNLGEADRTKLGYVASAFGIFSCISCSLVGVFPMNSLSVHDVVAYSFFYNGLVAVTLFTLVILFDRQNKLSKWLLIPGIITVISVPFGDGGNPSP